MRALGTYYQAEIHITKQEDGLWRLFVPGMKGAWVDAKTLEEGFSDIQEAIALMIHYYQERDWPLPKGIQACQEDPVKGMLPIRMDEYHFTTPRSTRRSKKA